MYLTIAVIFFLLWLLGFFALHVGGGLIHLLVVIAAIFVIAFFIRRSASRSASP